MKSKYIAAIEIGSSRIKGIVAEVDPTAAITILAVEEVDAGETVRYGRVQNAREVSTRVNEIVRRLENNPRIVPARINYIFVANGGRSLSSAQADATVRLGGEAEITLQILERLHNEARYNLATDRDVLIIAPRRFLVDNAEMRKIVGAFGNVVRGEFTIVTASPENRRALDRVKIESTDRDIPRDYITRLLAQTEMALTDSDRQLGCLFIDFGAETTTIAVFRDGALQMASVLPMGAANITRDLRVGLSMTFDAAEEVKKAKGRAVVERVNIDAPDDETREIINYVSARAGEIIANIINTLADAGIKTADLPAGIVITGGGSRLAGLTDMLEAQTKLKVRHAAVDASIMMDCPGVAADHFDVISLVKYAAAHSQDDCLEWPEGSRTPKAEDVAEKPSDASSTPSTPAGRRRRDIDLDDPRLLRDDDEDDDTPQPDNINTADPDLDDEDELPPPGPDAKATRDSLLRRFKNWIAPTVDDIDD